MSSAAGQMLDDMPIEGFVTQLARGIVAAQEALDIAGIRTAEAMAKLGFTFQGEATSLFELGFTPVFYQFVETTVEVKISISMSHESSEEHGTGETDSTTDASASLGLGSVSVSSTTHTTSVDARYSQRFQYSADASSMVSTRLVPVPPPGPLLTLAHALAKSSTAGGGSL